MSDNNELTQDLNLKFLSQVQSLQTEALRALALGNADRAKAIVLALDPAHDLNGNPLPKASPAPGVDPAALVRAIDVSSNNSQDLGPLLGASQAQHVVVKLYLGGYEFAGGVQCSVNQAASGRAHGASLGGYCWCYRAYAADRTINDALETAQKARIVLPILWLDGEIYYDQNGRIADRGPDPSWLEAAEREAQATKVPLGFYTGKWWWVGYDMQNTTAFSHLPLWNAVYDQQALLAAPGYGGWASEAGHQYSTAGNLDHSVFRAEVC